MKKAVNYVISFNILILLIVLLLILYNGINISTTNDIKENVIDKMSPTIELVNDKVTITINEQYIEPGYKAKDNIAGDITNKVKVTNNINIKRVGTYQVTYIVTDTSGNKTEKNRIVEVTRKIVPRQKTYTKTKTNNSVINSEITSIEKYLKNYKVSIAYINLNNGFTYIYNGNKRYFGASLIKVTDAMYIYENNLLTNYNRENVKKAITVSNNTAHARLVSTIGQKNLYNYIKSITNRNLRCNKYTFCDTTVHEQISYWLYLYELLQVNPNSEELKSYFKNEYYNSLSFDNSYTNLHKYGLTTPAYHDVGIFEGDSPYLIVVLTNEVPSSGSTKKATSIVSNISKRISNLNDLVEINY